MASSIIDSVIWKRLDAPGHDSCTLRRLKSGYKLEGVAVFLHGKNPACLRYRVTCGPHWKTQKALVTGTLGKKIVRVDIVRSKDHWIINDEPQLDASGRYDLDLSFTPATNILPIKRLAIDSGIAIEVNAAWLRFPSMTIETLHQTYRKLGRAEYAYTAFGGRFKRKLSLRPSGLVKSYPGLWVAERAV